MSSLWRTLVRLRFKAPFEERERQFWKPDQEIIYIGRGGKLAGRLGQFARHIYGNPSPHRGGQAILLLDGPKIIRWAAVVISKKRKIG